MKRKVSLKRGHFAIFVIKKDMCKQNVGKDVKTTIKRFLGVSTVEIDMGVYVSSRDLFAGIVRKKIIRERVAPWGDNFKKEMQESIL